MSTGSLRAALFGREWYELSAPDEFSDEPGNWSSPGVLDAEPPARTASPWAWIGPSDPVIEAPLWGGNLEIISWLLQAGRCGPLSDYAGHVLVIETSEEMPSDTEVFRMLRNMGERGLLGQFAAVLVGRAKAWHHDRPQNLQERQEYAHAQRAAIERALATYAPGIPVVFDLDIGHTDPQLILPIGGNVRVDCPARRITVRY
jgi:muramoyltetrapeptide carboxypeptidase LdcA involved in peptidoglycan recycling